MEHRLQKVNVSFTQLFNLIGEAKGEARSVETWKKRIHTEEEVEGSVETWKQQATESECCCSRQE